MAWSFCNTSACASALAHLASRVHCTMKRCLSDLLCVEYAPCNFSFVDNKHLLEGSCTSKARGLSMMGMIDQSLNDSFADAMHNLGVLIRFNGRHASRL
jgi:hypothetical protein